MESQIPLAPAPTGTTATAGTYISNPFGLISPAWTAFKLVWIPMLQLGLIGLTIGIVINLIPGFRNLSVEGSNSQNFAVLFPVLILVTLIVNSYTGWIGTKIMLSGVEGRRARLRDAMPSSLNVAIKFFVTNLLFILIVAGGFLLFIIPGIIWAIRYQYAMAVNVDEGLSGIAAIKRSGQLTKGHFWEVMSVPAILAIALPLVLIPIFGWVVLFVYALVVGVAGYVRYYQLKQLAAGQLKAVPTHFLNYLMGLLIILLPFLWIATATLAALTVIQQGGGVNNVTY